MGPIVMAIGGALIGGAINAGISYNTAMENAKAYNKAAQDVREATKKYSGRNAYNRMYDTGLDTASTLGMTAATSQLGQNNVLANPGQTSGGINSQALNNAQQGGFIAGNAANSGFQQGTSNAQNLMNAKYNANTQLAQNLMKQADVNMNVANQAAQSGFNTVSQGVDTYNQIKSDEDLKCKDQASVEDALRQIDSINYKYTPEAQAELGLDNDEHTGVTAQSVEDTALDNGMVSEDENGYKQLDKQKLMESIFAAQAALQKQIDELKELDTEEGEITSDEQCKDIENAIESNPEEMAEVLPEGSDIQQEAEQINDGDERTSEVNNEVVEKAVKKPGSFMIDLPDYNDMSIDDIEKADALAMAGDAPYMEVNKDTILEENADEPITIDVSDYPTELPQEEETEEVEEDEGRKHIGDGILLSPFGASIPDVPSGTTSSGSLESEPIDNSEITSGISPISPSFTGGGSSSASFTGENIETVENKVDNFSSNAGGGKVNTKVSEDGNTGSMNGSNVNEGIDNTLDSLSFETEHKGDIKSDEQADLPGETAHTAEPNEMEVPKLSNGKIDAEAIKDILIEDSKTWGSENSGSKYLPFKFTVTDDNDLKVSQIGTARNESFDKFIKNEPNAIMEIIHLI